MQKDDRHLARCQAGLSRTVPLVKLYVVTYGSTGTALTGTLMACGIVSF